MRAFSSLPRPTNTASSWRLILHFYNCVENHTRALSALGTNEESWGNLLVTMMYSMISYRYLQIPDEIWLDPVVLKNGH